MQNDLFAHAPTYACILSDAQIELLRHRLGGRLIQLCFGGGVDSTAMIVALRVAGIRPDVVTFADTGGEKPSTLVHVSRMNDQIQRWGWPAIDTVRKVTKPETPYEDLEGQCHATQTMPSLAYGGHSCSLKYKAAVQDQLLRGVSRGHNQHPAHPVWERSQAEGVRILKLIGYDAGKADLRRSHRAKSSDQHFDYYFPLQDLRWARPQCIAAIAAELGPDFVPIKSACFYCPASKPWEIAWLAANEPDLLERALAIEIQAMTGRHVPPGWRDAVDAGDIAAWRGTSTVGLGRNWSWLDYCRKHRFLDAGDRVLRDEISRARFSAMAAGGMDNALDARRAT